MANFPRERTGRLGAIALSLAVAGPALCFAVMAFPAEVHHVLGLAGGLHVFAGGLLATLLAPLLARIARHTASPDDKLTLMLARVSRHLSLAAAVCATGVLLWALLW